MSANFPYLKTQDLLMLLKIQVSPCETWTNRSLAASLFISVAEISTGLRRAEAARLYDKRRKRPMRRALEEFLVHGVKYAYSPQRGGLTRGMPTCYAAPPLLSLIVQPKELPPVWPDPAGTVQGYAFSPLSRSVPQAAAADANLYEILTLVDTIRDGRARETALAVRELQRRLHTVGDKNT